MRGISHVAPDTVADTPFRRTRGGALRAAAGTWLRLAASVALGWMTYSLPMRAGSLDQITPTWQDANLRATLEPANTVQVEQGSTFALRIGANADASIVIVVVSADGKAEVLHPQRAGTADRVLRGAELLFPDGAAGEALHANMPVGRAQIYVLATPEPLPADPENATYWLPEVQVGRKLAEALRAASTKVAVQRLEIEVKPPAVEQFISKEDFVAFYDPHGFRTRGLCHPSRGLAVQFATNSADLTEWGKKQLSEVAAGMEDKRLQEVSFVVEGHTDDVGTDSYNMGLSDRRAKRVFTYLTDRGIEDKRLKTEAKGKTNPAVPGTSEQARAQNRRVVIRRLEESPACKEAGP